MNEQNATSNQSEEEQMRENLLAEIKEFEREREQLKEALGRIGGREFSKIDNWINAGFLILVLGFFILELSTHLLPRLISLEVGVLLVSVKIVFMIHSQQKVNHFQFWVLNSIEYRINEISRRVRHIEKKIISDSNKNS